MEIHKNIAEAAKILTSKEFWKDFISYYSPEAIAERLRVSLEKEKQIQELKKELFMRERKLTVEECRLLALHTPMSLEEVMMVNGRI